MMVYKRYLMLPFFGGFVGLDFFHSVTVSKHLASFYAHLSRTMGVFELREVELKDGQKLYGDIVMSVPNNDLIICPFFQTVLCWEINFPVHSFTNLDPFRS